MAHVLVLHGSPGSGKTTLARAVSQLLSAHGVTNGVIDVDELNLVFPPPRRDFWLTNLATIWPNYAAVPGIHMVIPTVVADAERLRSLRAAVPAASFVVCELTAPTEVLKARVTAREPTEELRVALRAWVDHHAARADLDSIRDVEVSTHDRPIDEAAREVLRAVGWPRAAGAEAV
jgi:predicted kinase